jgi:hypothetical protein
VALAYGWWRWWSAWFSSVPALTETGDSAKSKLAAGTGVCHLMLVIALYFMVFKP